MEQSVLHCVTNCRTLLVSLVRILDPVTWEDQKNRPDGRFFFDAPRPGFEPGTFSLTASRSAVELSRNIYFSILSIQLLTEMETFAILPSIGLEVKAVVGGFDPGS